MNFTWEPLQGASVHLDAGTQPEGAGAQQPETGAVLLEPGGMLIMCGPARYEWRHGIRPVSQEVHEGRTITRGVRTSLTLRRLAEGIVLTEAA